MLPVSPVAVTVELFVLRGGFEMAALPPRLPKLKSVPKGPPTDCPILPPPHPASNEDTHITRTGDKFRFIMISLQFSLLILEACLRRLIRAPLPARGRGTGLFVN